MDTLTTAKKPVNQYQINLADFLKLPLFVLGGLDNTKIIDIYKSIDRIYYTPSYGLYDANNLKLLITYLENITDKLDDDVQCQLNYCIEELDKIYSTTFWYI